MFIPKRLAWHFAKRLNSLGATVSEQLPVDEITALHGGYQIRNGSSVIYRKTCRHCREVQRVQSSYQDFK